jgi:site-specific DNA recombinase
VSLLRHGSSSSAPLTLQSDPLSGGRPVWQAVQVRKEQRTQQSGPGAYGRAHARPKRPFSGLLRCGLCGGGITISKNAKEGNPAVWCRCSTRVQSGSCTNRREIRLDRIETAIFDALRSELEDPAYIRVYLQAYHEERQRLRASARQNRNELVRVATQARKAYDRAFRLYTQGVTDGAEAEAEIRRLLDAARAAETLAAEANAADDVVELHPASLDRYIAALSHLGPHLAEDAPGRAEAVQILRELISSATVTPRGDKDLEVTVEGYLASILGPALHRELLVPQKGPK